MEVSGDTTKEAVILGAGLAGLAAGYALSGSGMRTVVIEGNERVGGLARTVHHRGFRFDLGGHRFITNEPDIEHLVRELLQGEALSVRRSSKILLGDQYFDYPLRPVNAFLGLGISKTLRILLEYAAEQLKGRVIDRRLVSLEDWVVRHYGRSLFDIFFRQYSEKVWGIGCERICMEWVEQRIQGLSLRQAVQNALLKTARPDQHTLAEGFLYPPMGIGQIAERFAEAIAGYNEVHTNSRIVRIHHSEDRIQSVIARNADHNRGYRAKEFISSIPITALVQLLHPAPPAEVLDAACRLGYRDLVVVTIMINRERVTDQTWIYIPSPEIPFGRIHEPTNWSAQMAPPGQTLLVTEHFCFRGDDTWSASDESLIERTVAHLVRLGFIHRHEVIEGVVVRIPRAYPLFEVGYGEYHDTLCDYLARFRNLHLAGRAGKFRYYNMDHAMASGLAAANELLERTSGTQPAQQSPLAATGTDS